MSAVHVIEADSATYGELLSTSLDLIDHACNTGCGPFDDHQAARAAITGYQRLLGVSGRHLRLVAGPAHAYAPTTRWAPDSPPVPELITRLCRIDIECDVESRWSRAADRLALAHDLLATHVHGAGQPITPDGQVLSDPGTSAAATKRLLEPVARAAECAPRLLKAAALQRTSSRGSDEDHRTNSLSLQARRIAELARIATANTEGDDDRALNELDALSPEMPHISAAERVAQGIDSSIAALRLLRLIAFRQAAGDERSSIGSLHDLVTLGTTATGNGTKLIQTEPSALGTVRAAIARDAFDDAAAAWSSVDGSLDHNLRTLDKAPRLFADASRLLCSGATDERLTRATLMVLPSVTSDTADAVRHLARTGGLVRAARQPVHFEATWRPVTAADGDALAEQLDHAAQATSYAATRLPEPASYRAPARPAIDERPRSELSRAVSYRR